MFSVSGSAAGSMPWARSVADAPLWIVETLTSPQELRALEREWRDLEARIDDPLTYFQSYDWCKTWSKQFAAAQPGPNCKVRSMQVFAVRKEGKLAAVLPFAVYRKWGTVDVARLLGAPFCEYGNVLLDREEFRREKLPVLWREITERLNADVVAVDDFPERSPLVELIGKDRILPSAACYSSLIDLSKFTDWEDYTASLSKSARRNRKKRYNKLAKAGNLQFSVCSGGSPSFKALFDKAQELKVAWLQQAGLRDSTLSCPNFSKFISALPGDTLQPDGAMAAGLFLDDVPLAIEIGFCNGPHYFSYLGAFDPRYADYSPGKVQIEEMLKWALDNGITHYDLLGNPSQYKADWSNHTLDLFSYRAGLRPLGSLYCLGTNARLRKVLKSAQGAIPASLRKSLVNWID